MLSTGLLLSAVDPMVEVSSIMYQGGAFTLYLMINWLPSEASGFVDLERVHSTLGRYRFRAAPGLPSSREVVAQFWEELGETLEATTITLLLCLCEDTGNGRALPLARPPWPRSWNFGFTDSVRAVFDCIELQFRVYLTRRFGTMWHSLPSRPYHVSWS